MQDNGSPQPVFETDSERSSFIIKLPRHLSTVNDRSSRLSETFEATSEIITVLKALGRKELSRQDLQEALGLKNLEHFRLAYILPGLASGLIERTIPDKPSSSLQRYRATRAGLQYLRKLELSDGG